MRASLITLGSLTLLLAACGDDPDDPAIDGGSATDASLDAASAHDAGAGEDASASSDASTRADASTPGCGSARPEIAAITQTEGLVIARDGTMYYSQPGGVGRLAPGGAPEDAWVTIPRADTVWGLALDAANERLYVGVPSLEAVYVIDTTAADPSATEFVSDAGSPNGLTIGPDGALYFSDFGGGHVYRAATGGATATATRVTARPINSPNGVAFFADGALLVASYGTGDLLRLTLANGEETGRGTFRSLGAQVSPDGVAFDAEGRVYATDNSGGSVIRIEADGSAQTTVLTRVSSAASLEFGAGPLDCEDLYVTSSAALRLYDMGETPGAAVPWH